MQNYRYSSLQFTVYLGLWIVDIYTVYGSESERIYSLFS